MTKYGKIVDGEFVGVGKVIAFEKRIIVNPTHEQYLENGFLPVVWDDVPPYDPETEDIMPAEPYEKDGVIHRTYKVFTI